MAEHVESENEKFSRYLEERRHASEMASHNIRAFDKALLTLTSGALGLSFLFVDQFGGASIKYVWVLGATWLSYLVSILCNLQSFLSGWKAASVDVESLDGSFQNKTYASPPDNKYRGRTILLNRIAFWLFAAGTLLLCIFAFSNTEGFDHGQTTTQTHATTQTDTSAPTG